MAGPVQPHPPGSGIFLQGFSRGSCLHSLLFHVSLFGSQPGDIGSLEKGLEGLYSTKVGCAGKAYTGGPGKRSWRELECHGQECGFILKTTRLQMLHHSMHSHDHEKQVRFIN